MKQKLKTMAKAMIGLAISGLLLYMVFSQISPEKLWHSLSQANYFLVALGTITFVLALFVLPFRMQAILVANDFKKIPIFPLYKIATMSMMLNTVLPARLGEVSKGYFLVRREKTTLGVAVATVVTERLFDIIVVVALMTISFLSLNLIEKIEPVLHQLPDNLKEFLPTTDFQQLILIPLYGMVGLIVLLIILILIFRKNYEKFVFLLTKILFWMPDDHQLFHKLTRFFSEIKFFSHPTQLIEILFFSLLLWGGYSVSYYLYLLGFGIDIPYFSIYFIMGISAFAIAIPSAPGGLGVFEAACAFGIYLMGGSWEVAVSCAIILHVTQMISISVIGLYFLIKENISIKDVTASEDNR